MRLPATAELLIRLLGQPAALRMMDANTYGGRAFDVPKKEGSQTYAALVDLVGADGTAKLCKQFGGDSLYVPRCDMIDLDRRNREIVTKYNAGTSVWNLSSEYVLSDRQIWNILKKTDMGVNTQSSLFE